MKTIKSCLGNLQRSVLNESREPRIEKLTGLIKVIQPTERESSLDWHTVEEPERLRKSFELYDSETLKFFVNELLEYERTVKHNAEIRISGTKIVLEVYTHELNSVTEVDRDYTRMADNIYADAIDIRNRKDMLARRAGINM